MRIGMVLGDSSGGLSGMIDQIVQAETDGFDNFSLGQVFGVDALSYRLQNAGAKAVITNAAGLVRLNEARAEVPSITLVISIDGVGDNALGFQLDDPVDQEHRITMRQNPPDFMHVQYCHGISLFYVVLCGLCNVREIIG